MSDLITTSTGAPQGSVLSPLLFTVYTNDCRTHLSNVKLLKFADDSAIQGLLGSDVSHDLAYQESIKNFVEWCDNHYLLLNVKKTKELIVDFRKNISPPDPIIIKNESVEIVSSYKYLGVTVDNKLNWNQHVSLLHSKASQRLYFLRKLRSFHIDNTLISLFYKSIIESLLTFCIVCWGGNARDQDIEMLDKVTKKAGKVISNTFETTKTLYYTKCAKKLDAIMRDTSHPFVEQLSFSIRSGRILTMRCNRERYRRSFLPTAVRLAQGNES